MQPNPDRTVVYTTKRGRVLRPGSSSSGGTKAFAPLSLTVFR